jgi:hypothetical protein
MCVLQGIVRPYALAISGYACACGGADRGSGNAETIEVQADIIAVDDHAVRGDRNGEVSCQHVGARLTDGEGKAAGSLNAGLIDFNPAITGRGLGGKSQGSSCCEAEQ